MAMSIRARTLAVLLCLLVGVPPLAASESIGAYLLPIIEEHGVDVAIADYYEARRSRKKEFNFAERELNLLGYRLLRAKRYDDAVAILKLNIEMFPLSANAHDSLAEAYMRMGDTREAKKEYMRALSMLSRKDSARAFNRQFLERNIRIQLRRIEAYPILEPLVGIYRASDGRILSVAISEPNHGQVPPSLRLVEFPSGRARTLHRKGDLSYFTGPGLDLKSPVEERLEFVRPSTHESASKIVLRKDQDTVQAERIPIPEQAVSFYNGEVELEGSLIVPEGKGPRPAVILVHGSGKATRNTPGFGEIAHYLALNGYAVLRYDKRGWGDSALGDSGTPMLRDLAGDAVAAYRYLRDRRDVDAERIGLAGFSEGAWVAGVAAASRGADPDFVVLLSGGGVPPYEQEMYRVEAELRGAGFSDEDIESAVAFMNAKFDVARTGAGWVDFVSTMQGYRGRDWYKYAQGWPSAQFAQVAWLEVLGYEPASLLAKIDCPVLAVLGGKDLLTPVDATSRALQAAFDGDREDLLQITVLPDANHLLLESEVGTIRFSDELASTERYAPGFFTTVATWLSGRPGSESSPNAIK
jgi:pimeloyl-ACP methyl ester carboxylesterase